MSIYEPEHPFVVGARVVKIRDTTGVGWRDDVGRVGTVIANHRRNLFGKLLIDVQLDGDEEHGHTPMYVNELKLAPPRPTTHLT